MLWVLAKGTTVHDRAYIPQLFDTKEQAMKAAESVHGYNPEYGTRKDIHAEWTLFASHQLKKMKGRRKR